MLPQTGSPHKGLGQSERALLETLFNTTTNACGKSAYCGYSFLIASMRTQHRDVTEVNECDRYAVVISDVSVLPKRCDAKAVRSPERCPRIPDGRRTELGTTPTTSSGTPAVQQSFRRSFSGYICGQMWPPPRFEYIGVYGSTLEVFHVASRYNCVFVQELFATGNVIYIYVISLASQSTSWSSAL